MGLLQIYISIGFIYYAIELARLVYEEESPLVCLTYISVILLWPLHIIYKIIKKHF